MPDATFGERLRSIRLSHGLSRERLAEASGVSVRTIMGHETGRLAQPRWSVVVKLARLLGPALVGLD
jgi:transcriptional regulator with XRE-family HTH domain